MAKAADLAFKTLTGALGIATIFLTANFGVNLYNGISWHTAQNRIRKEDIQAQDQ